MEKSTEEFKDKSKDTQIESRIDAMARQDKIIAIIFTLAMWIVLLFVYFAVMPAVPTAEVSIALTISLVILGGANTASIFNMIRAYAKDKEFIYREDILNLDRNRQLKNGSKAEGGR